jgi:hypothetical protein
MDQTGNTIKTLTMGPVDCKKQCDMDPRCIGIVSYIDGTCALKSSLADPAVKKGSTIYKK